MIFMLNGAAPGVMRNSYEISTEQPPRRRGNRRPGQGLNRQDRQERQVKYVDMECAACKTVQPSN
ncbi:MAG: hypothetical protein DMG06_09735 [Acidobacteria bacterium]|nr:MAG: hypothetical protein DMG06_09735 [Acidobacteriota bacterium]